MAFGCEGNFRWHFPSHIEKRRAECNEYLNWDNSPQVFFLGINAQWELPSGDFCLSGGLGKVPKQ